MAHSTLLGWLITGRTRFPLGRASLTSGIEIPTGTAAEGNPIEQIERMAYARDRRYM